MKFFISENKKDLDNIDKRINTFLKNNIQGYSADRYGVIIRKGTQYALMIDDTDPRLPLRAMTTLEKSKLSDEDRKWKTERKNVGSKETVNYNYVR